MLKSIHKNTQIIPRAFESMITHQVSIP